uniref:hypothetical protein n=1 Tax=Zhongshania sp. TaxID=1971902 RepID=UPI00356982A8
PSEEVASDDSAAESTAPETADAEPSRNSDGLLASISTAVTGNGSIAGQLQGVAGQTATVAATLASVTQASGEWGNAPSQTEAADTNDSAEPESHPQEDDAQPAEDVDAGDDKQESPNSLSVIADAAAHYSGEINGVSPQAGDVAINMSASSSASFATYAGDE